MSYEERRSNQHFRTTMDLGMGLFYTAVGFYVVIVKAFGTMKIPTVLAYLLGGMMIVGGIARFYRGLKVVLPKKRDSDNRPSE